MSLGEWDWSEHAECPHTFQCSGGLVSFDIGRAPSYVSIASSTLSCFGSILIVATYCLLKGMRSGAQTVVTLLAVADFFTAFGYIIGSVNFLLNFTEYNELNKDCRAFTELCEIQSFITTWSTMSSYCWTCILAFYFFLILVFNKWSLASRLIPVYNIVAWMAPLLIVFPLLVTSKLGYAPYVASNWCYIKDMQYSSSLSSKIDVIVYILIAGKLWEVICYVFIVVLYSWIRISFIKTKQQFQDNNTEPVMMSTATVEKRLLAIPLLYIFLRMWGTLQFFYSLSVANQNEDGCIPKWVQTIFLVFGIFQAIGDGGQGWCNAILYIFFSPTIRRKLFRGSCLHTIEVKLQKLLESSMNENHRIDPERAVVSEIQPRRQSEDEIAESTHQPPGVAASGYKIRKYSDGSNSQSVMSSVAITASRHYNEDNHSVTVSNKINC